MNESAIKKHYFENKDNLERLWSNIVENLKILLNDKKIQISMIKHRIKSEESILDKFQRKNYESIEKLEDFCWIRIVCYYHADITRIEEILKKEFKIIDTIDKDQECLEKEIFWYRWTQFIAQIKEEWSKMPVFSWTKWYKFEIQVRTILIEAWAEIEHKLSYKSNYWVPKEIKREFSTISCFLEDIDEKFQILRTKTENYIKETTKKIQSGKLEGIEMNLVTLEILLSAKWFLKNIPEEFIKKSINSLYKLLTNKVTLIQFSTFIDKNKDILEEFWIDCATHYLWKTQFSTRWNPSSMWTIHELSRLKFLETTIFSSWKKAFIKKWQAKLL